MNNKSIQKEDLITLYLNNEFSYEEAVSEIDFAIEILSGISTKDMILGIMPDQKTIEHLKKIVQTRVTTHQPIAQLLEKTFFMGQKFDVNSNTLIPRPETELLVRTAVDIIKKNNYKQILDIGTGSGCIACMIAKLTDAQVLGVDISNDALKISLNNAMHHDLMNRALFRKSDIFSKIRPEEKFDLIASNPPYIPIKERPNLQIEVGQYEPPTALFTADERGMEFYEKIAKDANKYLNSNGHLIFEIGINQACFVKQIMESNCFVDIKVLKDVTGIERVIYGHI